MHCCESLYPFKYFSADILIELCVNIQSLPNNVNTNKTVHCLPNNVNTNKTVHCLPNNVNTDETVHCLPNNVNTDETACLYSNPFTLSKRNILTINDYDC